MKQIKNAGRVLIEVACGAAVLLVLMGMIIGSVDWKIRMVNLNLLQTACAVYVYGPEGEESAEFGNDQAGNAYISDPNTGKRTLAQIETGIVHAADNSQAHTDYMLNTGDTVTGTYDMTGTVLRIADPVELDEAVNFATLLDSIGVALNYWIGNQTLSTIYAGGETYITETPASDPETLTSITFKSTVIETPTPFILKAGDIVPVHISAKVTTAVAKYNEQLYCQLGYVDADGTSNFTQIGANSDITAVLTTTKTPYELHIHVNSDTEVPAGKRLWLKVVADASGSAPGFPEIWVYHSFTTHHIVMGVAGDILGNFVQKSGDTMTGDLDMGVNILTDVKIGLYDALVASGPGGPLFEANNNSGGALNAGRAAYIDSWNAGLSMWNVRAADTDATNRYSVGLFNEDIANGAQGMIRTSGIVEGLSTVGSAVGDIWWVTDSSTTSNNIVRTARHQAAGRVVNVDASDGAVEVLSASWMPWLIYLNNHVDRTASGSVTPHFNTYLYDASGAARTVTLEGVAFGQGRINYITKVDSTPNLVTVDGSGGETIDGAADITLPDQGDTVIIYTSDDEHKVLYKTPTWVEKWQIITPAADATWTAVSLSGYGVEPGDVCEIIMWNTIVGAKNTSGVRELGSALARTVDLHEAEGAGYPSITMTVRAMEAAALIYIYEEDDSDVVTYLTGYWSK